MKRTSDVAFFECPICGNKPYVRTFNVNYGIAYCGGSLFKRHRPIMIETGYCNPSKLFHILSEAWNDSHWKAINDLPIHIRIEQKND